MKKLLFAAILILNSVIFSQTFTDIGLDMVDTKSSAWGDYDNDGDIDVLTGNNIYSNDSLLFNLAVTPISDFLPKSTDWGDYDSDGDLDVLLDNKLYQNSMGSFTLVNEFNTTLYDPNPESSLYYQIRSCFIDYDNDGDLDIFLSGSYRYLLYDDPYDPLYMTDYTTWMYKNNSDGTFSVINMISINEVYSGYYEFLQNSFSWGDYDNDGDQDLFLSYNSDYNTFHSIIYRNESPGFTDINAGLIDLNGGSASWGDYDNDGDLDILYNGTPDGTSYYTYIYENDNGSFPRSIDSMQGLSKSSCEWGDFDNDGDLDVLLKSNLSYNDSKIYRNDDGTFTDTYTTLTCGSTGNAVWGDFDNDDDLDILCGDRIYRNDTLPVKFRSVNTPPVPPANLISQVESNEVKLSWERSSDSETPQGGLSYNLFIGTESGSCNVLSPESDLAKGYRKIVAKGNAGQLDSMVVLLPNGTYYWSVQAIDHGFTGSQFASEESFIVECPVPETPVALESNYVTSVEFRAIWNAVDLADGYYLDVARDSLFTDFLSVYQNKDVGNVTYIYITGLEHNKEYFYRVRAYDGLNSSLSSNIICVKTPELFPPSELFTTNLQENSFIAVWWTASSAKGYYIDVATDSSFTNFLTGYENKDVKNNTSCKIENLTSDTEYYWRVRTYNSGGISAYSDTILIKTITNEFADDDTNIPYAVNGSLAYGDYDNDGDLDLLMAGSGNTVVYRNDGDMFRKTYLNLPGVSGYDSSVSWGDYDSDGYLDILITGWIPGGSFGESISRVYRNNGDGTFTNIDAGLIGMRDGCGIWCDYDNDGDLDIFISGENADQILLYRNDNGSFTNIISGLHYSVNCSIASFDYDNDGYLDLVVSGYPESSALWDFDNIEEITKIYRNNADGTFSDSGITLKGLAKGKVCPGDYNNDGFTDLLITGVDTSWGPVNWEEFNLYDLSYAYVYRNNGNGTFTNINAGLTGVEGSATWYDCDNDGDLDIFISGQYYHSGGEYGYFGNDPLNTLYINNSGTFTKNILDNSVIGNLLAGDHDNDGDTDIFITGEYGSKFIMNNSATPNVLPSAPSNLSTVQSADNNLTFSWDKASDTETPQNGLSYNLYLGTESLTGNAYSPMSDITTGYSKVVSLGNAQQDTTWTIKDLAPGSYYWSVQAIDHGYAGSLFATEQTITVTGIEESIPHTTELYQNYPNPFNPSTEIKFSLAEDSKVNLSVYNTNGQLVRTLIDGKMGKGFHTEKFDASELNSGMYLYRLDVNGKVQTRKMIMLK